MKQMIVILLLSIILPLPTLHAELKPDDIWIIVNKNHPASQGVADHYCGKRGVPKDHQILLDIPYTEEMSRADFDKKMREPLREKLASMKGKEFVLVTTFGVPIRVKGGDLSPKLSEKKKKLTEELEETKRRRLATEMEITLIQGQDKPIENKSRLDSAQAAKRSFEVRERQLQSELFPFTTDQSHAAVDSELALMWWEEYPLGKWIINPRLTYYGEAQRKTLQPVVLVSRLDGPTATVAKRIIDDAVTAEAAGGPGGMAYIDARGMAWDKKTDLPATNYGGYDESFRELATLLTEKTEIKTKLDNADSVFAPNTCPNCGFYFGWYALENYTPAFQFNKGAVAIHIASFEAVSLREKDKKRWVPCLLDDGACVTIGPVQEPYLVAFPKPYVFSTLLLSGQYSVVECYFKSVHLLSWQMMLIGDPLYNPYKKNPKLDLKELRQSPVGSIWPGTTGGVVK